MLWLTFHTLAVVSFTGEEFLQIEFLQVVCQMQLNQKDWLQQHCGPHQSVGEEAVLLANL